MINYTFECFDSSECNDYSFVEKMYGDEDARAFAMLYELDTGDEVLNVYPTSRCPVCNADVTAITEVCPKCRIYIGGN